MADLPGSTCVVVPGHVFTDLDAVRYWVKAIWPFRTCVGNGALKVGALEACVLEVGTLEARATEVGPVEIRIVESARP